MSQLHGRYLHFTFGDFRDAVNHFCVCAYKEIIFVGCYMVNIDIGLVRENQISPVSFTDGEYTTYYICSEIPLLQLSATQVRATPQSGVLVFPPPRGNRAVIYQ